MVGDNGSLDAETAKGADFLEDSDMTPPVGEERGGGDHQHPTHRRHELSPRIPFAGVAMRCPARFK